MVESVRWTEETKGQGKVSLGTFFSSSIFKLTRSGDDEEDRLPKVSFHIMKEKQLRELLARYELSTVGDKNTLVARYQQCVFRFSYQLKLTSPSWSMLYNSNQDRSSKQRQTHDQLRTKLKKWEELGKGKKVVVEDSNEYQVSFFLKRFYNAHCHARKHTRTNLTNWYSRPDQRNLFRRLKRRNLNH